MEKKEQPEIGTDVVFVTIVVLGRITRGLDGMILPTDIVHNDVIRYLTIRLGSWR